MVASGLVGTTCAIRIPKTLVERQMAMATKIPMISNIILFVNIVLTGVTNRHEKYLRRCKASIKKNSSVKYET